MSTNPYESPTAASEAPILTGPSVDGAPAASQNKRLVNFIVDNIVLQVLGGVAGFAIGMMYVVSAGGQITPAQQSQLQSFSFIVGILVALMYFVILEGLFKLTLGKLLTGTRVVNAAGGQASFGQIIGRSFARMIPFEPFSFLFGDTTTGWHDTLSGTRVVDLRKARK